MEFGLDAALPIYSGGLGILAGDVIKAAGDASAPIVGIGIFWNRGYTRQTLDGDGLPVDAFPPSPRDALTATGVRFDVEIEGASITCTAHKVNRFTCGGELYLIEPLGDKDRELTACLYGGGARARVAQEILLGVGGIRMLRALGREVDVYHFNEGHAVFAGLELVREKMSAGLSFAAAAGAVRNSIVFTTHTPVPAGNEEHPIEMLTELGAVAGFDTADIVELGGSPFSMTVAGLRLARDANAVAELHGETAQAMWKQVEDAAPIVAITNGVHRGTWQDAAALHAARTGDHEKLLSAHRDAKLALLAEIASRSGKVLNPKGLVVGFARRAATYKRADLVLSDRSALDGLLAAGLQLVFAGKAHPADVAGKRLIAKIAAAAKEIPAIVFLEDYDMVLGALLTRGSDVWLNNPLRPKEACGTSGMKAAMNGVLNLSILDGWWPEGCVHGENGWHIVAADGPEVSRDARDRDALLHTLSEEVLPAFGDRSRWAQMMAASIAMSTERFSAARMVADYQHKLYGWN